MPMFSNEEKISVSCFMFILDSLTVYINSSSHLNTILFQSVGRIQKRKNESTSEQNSRYWGAVMMMSAFRFLSSSTSFKYPSQKETKTNFFRFTVTHRGLLLL